VRARAPAVLLAGIGAALVLGAVARSAAGVAPTFAVAMNYAIGRVPGAVSTGDLNADGAPDVVTTDPFGEAGNKLTVLLNRGDGTFGQREEYKVGVHPSPAEVRDLDGNGSLDLVTANYVSNSVSVLLNRGDGMFASAHGYGTGKGAEQVVLADLNGDGSPDLVTASQEQSTISVLLNNGNGTFRARSDYQTGKRPVSVVIGDLNGDGSPDLATADGNGVSLFLNRGGGTFEARRTYRIAGGSGGLAIGDLNDDGKPDLVTSFYGGIGVLLNRGDGTFARRDHRARFAGTYAIIDLNGDKEPDLAANDLDGVSILLNHGDGTFGAGRNYPAPGCSSRRDDACVYQQVPVSVRDINQDGAPDFMSVNPARNAAYIWLNRGNGSFEAGLGYAAGSRPLWLAIADLDSDRKQDVVTANYSSKSVAVLLNRGAVCNVQDVRGLTPAAARQTLARVKCRVGAVTRAYSRKVVRGRVISQKPKFGAVLPKDGKVKLVISKGKRK
jgi:hypothetical protein